MRGPELSGERWCEELLEDPSDFLRLDGVLEGVRFSFFPVLGLDMLRKLVPASEGAEKILDLKADPKPLRCGVVELALVYSEAEDAPFW